MTDDIKLAGSISWIDLTVPNAEQVRVFYERVVGWAACRVEMGEYADYCMNKPDGGQTVAGICHARGPNANMPAQWLIYITVPDLSHSIEECRKHGGQLLDGPRRAGQGTFAVIRDPAGAVAGLYQFDRDSAE